MTEKKMPIKNIHMIHDDNLPEIGDIEMHKLVNELSHTFMYKFVEQSKSLNKIDSITLLGNSAIHICAQALENITSNGNLDYFKTYTKFADSVDKLATEFIKERKNEREKFDVESI